MYNYSVSFGIHVPYLMNRISNTLAQSLKNNSFTMELTGIKTFPTHKDNNGDQIDIISLYDLRCYQTNNRSAGNIFYILILHQLLPVFLANIASEKELKIKEMTSMMGLKMPVYWLVQYIFNYILYLGVIIFLIIAGFIFQIPFFTINAFGSYFILFIVSFVLLFFIAN
jgi:hypothetical protein